jgi:hypothetical protein
VTDRSNATVPTIHRSIAKARYHGQRPPLRSYAPLDPARLRAVAHARHLDHRPTCQVGLRYAGHIVTIEVDDTILRFYDTVTT